MNGGVPEDEAKYASELYPSIGALASALGDDGTGKYASFLAEHEPDYPHEAWFLWNQPMWDSGYTGDNSIKDEEGENGDGEETGRGGSVTTNDQGDAAGQNVLSRLLMAVGVTVSVVAVSFS